MNKQREIIYKLRRDALLSENPHEVLFSIIDQVVQDVVAASGHSSDKEHTDQLDGEKLAAQLNILFPLNFTVDDFTNGIQDGRVADDVALSLQIIDKVEQNYNDRNADVDAEQVKYLERHTILEAIDRLWQEHLYAMDNLRSSMQLRAYAQKDPLVEYKHEAFGIFRDMMSHIYREVASNLFRITVTRLATLEELLSAMPQELVHQHLEQFAAAGLDVNPDAIPINADEFKEIRTTGFENMPPEAAPEVHIPIRRQTEKVGRNDLCPCGSGKKYKKCCGKAE